MGDARGRCFSDITAVSWGPHRIDLFYIGESGTIQHLFWNGQFWDLENLGGTATGNLAAAAWGVGKLAVFHRGMNNGMWVNLWHDDAWHGWTSLGVRWLDHPSPSLGARIGSTSSTVVAA